MKVGFLGPIDQWKTRLIRRRLFPKKICEQGFHCGGRFFETIGRSRMRIQSLMVARFLGFAKGSRGARLCGWFH